MTGGCEGSFTAQLRPNAGGVVTLVGVVECSSVAHRDAQGRAGGGGAAALPPSITLCSMHVAGQLMVMIVFWRGAAIHIARGLRLVR